MSQKNEIADPLQRRIYFELENIAIEGRQIIFDVLKEVLKEKNVKLTKAMFIKHGLSSLPAHYVPALLAANDKPSKNTKTLEKKVGKKLVQAFSNAKMNSGLKKLIEVARKENIRVIAVSPHTKKIATKLLSQLGLDELGVELFTTKRAPASFPSIKTWMYIIRNEDLHPRASLVLSSFQESCQGALTVDMSVVAIVDEFTKHQDFSGVSYVLDSLSEVDSSDLIELMLSST